ncbi:ArsB/NhaD family transporter [Mesobacillus zeae]|uniref:Citrate transporter-like domain-containing protein n=1 Tax=Mesobacillus zeae TaxID=1917180 RepID=A0A398BFM2_9BACI|nr:ArsB/NhaD family transporter [Mesobacillus zeae]RID88822.1 hypothetical protein D1970_00825 [Mesobacillus zeae]
METQSIIALGIFIIAYGIIISERIHRTIIAMLGGLAMVMAGVLDQETAIHHVDFNTIGLLIGMMVIVSIMSRTGLFSFMAVWLAKLVKGNPLYIFIVLNLFTAAASAFLDNVTTVLLVVPVTISIARQLDIKPLPFLISLILSSNIGGTATMIGDPPNIMIGSSVEELTFLSFIENLGFICFLILIVTIAIFSILYRKQLRTTEQKKSELLKKNALDEIEDPVLLKKSLAVTALTITGFFAHQFIHIETATIALAGAFFLLLLAGREHLNAALEKIEWTTLFFFVGLFIMVGGLVETGWISMLADKAMELTGGEMKPTTLLILWMSAIVSAFVDNIPFVATMIPMIKEMGNMGITNLEPLWWALSLGACLGGNGTLVGASANLVVAGLAAAEGHKITFIDYLKVGFPLMILSIVIATVYLYFSYLV